jgi:NAD(P)-dependent dehydrogenase (short-subunit alcohol dehydrogenase family)
MNLHLDDKLALVTASTGGIGKEIATPSPMKAPR